MVTPSSQDPAIRSYREQIAAVDQEILKALNARIHLVGRLRELKEARGMGFHDPAQEARVLEALAQANPGPLSQEGLRAVFGIILEWAKRDAVTPPE